MNAMDRVDGIAERLRGVADAAVNPSVASEALRLVSRLNSPVRVVLLGVPGAGKLTLLNALTSEHALPEAARGVTVELRYGDYEAAEITFSDGSVTHHEGPLDEATLADAAFAVVERPCPVLKRTSILNLVASADPKEQKSAIAWASKRTDIAIWCAATFDDLDRQIWAAVPDRIRDHGILVLTAADADAAWETKVRHRDDFVDVYAVDLAAGEFDNGIGELADRIAYHADLGRRADLDSALLFLKAQRPRERSKPRTTSRPLSKPRPMTRPRPVTTPRPDSPMAVEATAREVPAQPVPRALYGAGFSYLRDRSAALLELARGASLPTGETVLSHCSETLMQLSDLVTGHEDAAEAAGLTDTIMEAESLVILLENERGDDAAIDAVSILLQIRREFEVGLAA